jgi:hypothetical protein
LNVLEGGVDLDARVSEGVRLEDAFVDAAAAA